jgi:hypothetical protein
MHSSRQPISDRLGEKRICTYAGVCRHYRLADATCNSEENAESYCCTYDVFDNFKVKKHEELGQ